MYILGLNCAHDSTAGLIKDGQIIAAIAEERLTRKKQHLGFPYLAIRECLKIGNIKPKDVDFVTIAFKDYLRGHPFFTNLILTGNSNIDVANELSLFSLLKEFIRQSVKHGLLFHTKKVSNENENYSRKAYENTLKKMGFQCPLIDVEHHLAHAASAYYTSGFNNCLLVTIDGSGDGLSGTVNSGKDGLISRICETHLKFSPGVFYSAVTKYLGFKRHRHEGKITGLAAYGNPEICYPVMANALTLSKDKKSFSTGLNYNFTLFQNLKWFFRLIWGRYFRSQMTNLLLDYFSKKLKKCSRENIAAAAQKRLEDCVVEHVEKMVKDTGLSKVALAGGVFSNVKLNQKISELPVVEDIFIHPDMGDGGTALGGAFVVWAEELQKKGWKFMPFKIHDVYFGPEYSNEEIKTILEEFNLKYNYYENIEEVIARYIADKYIVGRFSGRMEYGPRALGNRSILVESTDVTVNDWLNKRLCRTEFMPFAPVILSDETNDFFNKFYKSEHAADFMTITFDATEKCVKLAPAICHVDKTARPQVISPDINASYFKIIEEYKKITGLPLLINTSFNAHEEPIICTPADAIKSFLRKNVDILAIGNYIVESKYKRFI
ncbi:MAG: carbamoyltransferase C-terminal domain-containing protein [Elusimicrobia bacterium]|nr:carbamoyltransferase C-terminal domain-containing protein [Elusimicrobiota bacterium]